MYDAGWPVPPNMPTSAARQSLVSNARAQKKKKRSTRCLTADQKGERRPHLEGRVNTLPPLTPTDARRRRRRPRASGSPSTEERSIPLPQQVSTVPVKDIRRDVGLAGAHNDLKWQELHMVSAAL